MLINSCSVCVKAKEVAEDEELNICVVRDDGVRIIENGERYYINTNINITVDKQEDDKNIGDFISCGYEYTVVSVAAEQSAYGLIKIDKLSPEVNPMFMYKKLDSNVVKINMTDLPSQQLCFVLIRERLVKNDYNDVNNEFNVIYRYSKPLFLFMDDSGPVIDINSDVDLKEWCNKDIKVNISASDKAGLKSIKVFTVNGAVISENYYDTEGIRSVTREVVLSDEATDTKGNEIKVIAIDKAGNVSYLSKEYYIDKTEPRVSVEAPLEGAYAKDVFVSASWQDNIIENSFLYYKAEFITDNTETVLEENILACNDNSGLLERSYVLDGEYILTCYAYDLAGNITDFFVSEFRIDKAAPRISYEGLSDGGKYNNIQKLSILLSDNYPYDTTATISCVKTGPGGLEIKELKKPTISEYTSRTDYVFSEEGRYKISVEAYDLAGNSSSISINIKIDFHAPIIEIMDITPGTELITNTYPRISSVIRDNFYDNDKLEMSLYKRNADGILVESFNEVHDINESNYPAFVDITDEGEYELKLLTYDDCGNKDEKTIHFIVDATAPIIGYIDTIRKKYFKSFSLPKNIKDYILDDTEVNVNTYLNMDNYVLGENINKDGRYHLIIIAKDSAGNESSDQADFIVDNVAPQVLFFGLRQDGTARKNKPIRIGLLNDNDYFISCKVNGDSILPGEFANNVVFYPNKFGKYTLQVEATDFAGNKIEKDTVIYCTAIIGLKYTMEPDKKNMNTDMLVDKDEEPGKLNIQCDVDILNKDVRKDNNSSDESIFAKVLFYMLFSLGLPLGRIKKILNNT